MKWFNSFLLAVLLGPSVLAQQEDANLEKFFREYLEESFRQRPLDATRLGDHRFDHLLDDLSKGALERNLQFAKKILKDLSKQIDYKKLSRDSQIDFEIFQHELETGIWVEENTHPFETNPRIYNEYISDSVFQLLAQSRLPKETNIANCISRIGQIPKVIAAARENLKNPPRPVLDTAIRQNKGSISFYEQDIFELAGETRQKDALKAAREGRASSSGLSKISRK